MDHPAPDCRCQPWQLDGSLRLHAALFQPIAPALAAWQPFNLERRTGKHLALRAGA